MDRNFSFRLQATIISMAAFTTLAVFPCSVSAKKTVIRWWVGDLGVGAGQVTLKELATMYEKEHPGVEIQFLTGDSIDKFYTMITAGMMPDIWGPYKTPGIKADVNRNWVEELTPYINRDAKSMDLQDFYPGLIREFRVNGKQYALPYINWEDYFFYNPVMYAQAGLSQPPVEAKDKSWNWDRMVLNAQKLTKYNNNGSIKIAGIEFERGLANPPTYMSMWGAYPYSEKALRSSVPQQVDWNTPEAVTAFTKAHELIYKYRVAYPLDSWAAFEGQKVAQQIKPGWLIQYIMPAKTAKWAIAPLPWAVTNRGTMWPDGWRMSRTCKNKAQTWDFIKFLCSKRALTYLVANPKSPFQATPMARRSVFEESLGPNISKLTGMKESDVLKIQDQADAVNIVKYQETICLHVDLTEKYLNPILLDLWANKTAPGQTAAKLQETTNKQLPGLFNRWLRNIKFTGRD